MVFHASIYHGFGLENTYRKVFKSHCVDKIKSQITTSNFPAIYGIAVTSNNIKYLEIKECNIGI